MKFGKDIYVSSPEIAEEMKGTIYTVKLVTSKKPLDIPTDMEGEKVMEYRQGNRYEYLLGVKRDKKEAEILLKKAIVIYPESKLAKYENGVEISIKD